MTESDFVKNLHDVVDRWHALPEDERERLIATADETTRARIAALTESATTRQRESRRRPPPDDDPREVPVILV